ncbi:alpha/beta hydrolase [Microbacterium sp. NPDC019599]|uniref:alpha/beta hydrolase n=1 Tax=Microbacterium sp. NPDC019599 TaxID=3154690 RepID=UPI0033C7573F
MGDIYFERLQAGAAAWESTNPIEGGDAELIMGLLAPRAGEADYVAPEASTSDHRLPVAGGEFGVRVYRPLSERPRRSLLVWCHGGSFFSGDLDMHESDAVAREISARADAVVVAVDYRLALGIHFPALHDDVVAAFDWAVDHADELGIDTGRISLGGASAGGNLAAGAALALRDRGGIQPVSTLLLYPLLHPVLPQASAELGPKVACLSPMLQPSADLVEAVVENYIGAPASKAPAYAMPGVSGDLTGFPRTLILNSEYDGMRASAEAFAEQLRRDGADVTEVVEPGVYHGHLGRGGGAPFLHSVAVMAEWLHRTREEHPAYE